MKVIAESSSTRTEWALIEGNQLIAHAITGGLNPYFQTRREISHCIRLELPSEFFRRRWDHVHYYGAGCANQEKCKLMELSLIAQFKTPVTVESNVLAAARGLFVREPGLACIIGTGTNSCTYNGEKITKNVRSLGFILGDEGGGSYMGKRFISDCLKGLAPADLVESFFDEYNIRVDDVMDKVYTGSLVPAVLANYANFLAHNVDNPYVYNLIYDGFMQFFLRNIVSYNYNDYKIGVVGRIATKFEPILRKAATDFGIKLDKVRETSMPGLIEYHSKP